MNSSRAKHACPKNLNRSVRENPCWRGTRRIRVPMLTNTPAIPSRLLHNNRHAPQWATEPQKDRVSQGFGGGCEATPSWMRHQRCPRNLCWGYCVNCCRLRFAEFERDFFSQHHVLSSCLEVDSYLVDQALEHLDSSNIEDMFSKYWLQLQFTALCLFLRCWGHNGRGSINRKRQHMSYVVSTE